MKYSDHLLIIGTGGYIDSVALPIILNEFPRQKLGIISRRPSRTVTVSEQTGIKKVNDLAEIREYGWCLLAVSPLDYPEYLEYINPKARLWLEKPISALSINEHLLVSKALESFKDVRVGFNKRFLSEDLKLKQSKAISGSVSLRIERQVSTPATLWKDFLVDGGVYWTDGVHAFDFGLYLAGEKSNIRFLNSDFNELRAMVTSAEGSSIEVVVGNRVEDRIELNGSVLTGFSSNEVSRRLFSKNFNAYLKGEENLSSCLRVNEACVNAFGEFKAASNVG